MKGLDEGTARAGNRTCMASKPLLYACSSTSILTAPSVTVYSM